MKIFSAFKTVPWEQREPDRRAIAVRDESAPELLALLPKIATDDPEPIVRRAALARVNVASLLLDRHRNDPDAATRAAALTRLGKLLLDPHGGLATGARLGALSLDLPAELLERVAETSPDVDMRRAALARITRVPFLARRCADDPDASIRESLLARIDGEEALDRLAEALRKRDKNAARSARERAEALRLQRGDGQALQRYALQLCESLTTWAQQMPADVDARLATAGAEWESRRAALDETTQRRVDAYFARVQEALARREQRNNPPAPLPPPPDSGPEATAPLVMQGESAYAPEEHPVVVEPLPAAPVKPSIDWSPFDSALADAKRAVAAQRLGDAKQALQQVHAVIATGLRPDRARRDRLTEIEAGADELDQWSRWAGNRVRSRLCDDVETLIAANHHPDAVANRVRELQQEWAKVEAAEPGDADRTSGLAKRFRALCGRAMAPTRPYFEQRHALREGRRAALDTLLAEVNAEPVDSMSPQAVIGLRRKLTEALRSLDDLEPKARSGLAKRLREGLTRLDGALDAQRADAALARRKLIARLKRELTNADAIGALELARNAQMEWKTLPRASREEEGTLDQELRALIDPLFAKEREQREQSAQQLSHVESESRRILAELDALAKADPEGLAHADGRVAALQAAWKELHAKDEGAAPPRDRDARGGMRGNDRGGARPGERGAPRGAGSDRPASRAPGGAGGRDDRGGARRDARDGGRGDARGPRRDDARGPRPNDGERALDAAVAKVRQAQAVRDAARRGERLQALAEASALFAQVEQDEIGEHLAKEQWNALALDETDRRRLHVRWEQAQTQRGIVAVDDAAERAAEAWLVEAELDAGVESPAAAQAARRQLQMQRLATRMQGAGAAQVDARARMLAWALLGSLDPARRQERGQRLDRVLAAMASTTS